MFVCYLRILSFHQLLSKDFTIEQLFIGLSPLSLSAGYIQSDTSFQLEKRL